MIYQALRIFDGGIPDRVLGRGSTIALFRVFALVKQKIKNYKIKKAEVISPRLIIRNVLYTSFMNSLLNIKYRVISYTLFVTHGRCLFCSVGIIVIFRIILYIIFTFYFFYKYLPTSLMTPRDISWSKLIMYNLCYSLLFLRL